MWEFLLGSLLFWLLCFHPQIKFGNVLSILGLLLILGTAFVIPKSLSFPGYVALIPTLGAAMLIFSGSNNSTVISHLLASRPLVYIGGLSFTIYLWHWPLLVFYKSYYNVKNVGIFPGVAIIFSSVLLAIITTKIIDAPIKNLRLNERMSSFSLLALVTFVFTMPVLGFSYYYFYSQDELASESFKSYTFDMDNAYNSYGVVMDEVSMPIGKVELISAKKFLPSTYANGCHQHINKSYVSSCELGDLTSDKLLVVVGGSHIAQWLPALNMIGTRNGYKIISITKSDCPLGIVPKSNDSCVAWNKSVLEEVISISPYAVITNSTRTTTTNEYVPPGYVDQWKALSAKGIELIGIRDNPRFAYDVPDCVYKKQFGGNARECSKTRDGSLEKIDPSIVYSNLLTGIDMSDMLCGKDTCPVTNQGMLMYRDAHHIHIPYVMHITKVLESRLLSSFQN